MINENTKKAIAERTKAHPHQESRVIEHPGYEPFVKLVCPVCGAEAYVKRVA